MAQCQLNQMPDGWEREAMCAWLDDWHKVATVDHCPTDETRIGDFVFTGLKPVMPVGQPIEITMTIKYSQPVWIEESPPMSDADLADYRAKCLDRIRAEETALYGVALTE